MTCPCQIPCSVFAILSGVNSRALLVGMTEAGSIRLLWGEQFAKLGLTIACSWLSVRVRPCAHAGLGARPNAQQTTSMSKL